mmetsp:Transcript_27410/g.63656  ORF Transcript_27410/g.63656 Transcript_27410/m.63656 type:complete len:431 (-) Transcript_27410:337-1629(-)
MFPDKLEDLTSVQENIRKILVNKREPEVGVAVERVVQGNYQAYMGTVGPSIYKASVLKTYDTCMLGISLGSRKFENGKFEGCITWISEHFRYCYLVVADSIYRYTLQVMNQEHGDEEACRGLALSLGNAFIAQHNWVIKHYAELCNFEWVRMSQVEKHIDFEHRLNAYRKYYAEDAALKMLINNAAKNYLVEADTPVAKALAEQERSKSLERNIDLCSNYFLEEMAIFTCLHQQGCKVMVYPGSIKPLEVLSERKVAIAPKIFIQIRLNLKSKGIRCVASNQQTHIKRTPCGDAITTFLGEEEWSHMLRYMKLRQFKLGDVITLKGSSERVLKILSKGTVEVLSGDLVTGTLKQLRIYKPISLIDQEAFWGLSSSNNIVALEDSEVWLLSKKSCIKMSKHHPHVLLSLIRYTIESLRKYDASHNNSTKVA